MIASVHPIVQYACFAARLFGCVTTRAPPRGGGVFAHAGMLTISPAGLKMRFAGRVP
jgi:hypothetical protein